jgi:hypothetical protein
MTRHRRHSDLFRVSYDAFCVPADEVLFKEHDDMDDKQRAAKRRRIEDNARRYLMDGTFHIQSATLKGPFDTGWHNPWRTKGVDVQQPLPVAPPQLPKPHKQAESAIVTKRDAPRRNKKASKEPRERTKLKMGEKKPQIRRAPKPTVQREKQLELIRSDSPTGPPTPQNAVQHWLRRVPPASPSPTGATFDGEDDIFHQANHTPSKTSAIVEKHLCIDQDICVDASHHAKSIHPASSHPASPVVIAFTPINQGFQKTTSGEGPVQGQHSHIRTADEVLVHRTPSEGHTSDQKAVEPGAKKNLNPHRFKQQSRRASENVSLQGNERWHTRNHLYLKSSKPRFMTFESPLPGPSRSRRKSVQKPGDEFSGAHPMQIDDSRQGVSLAADAILAKNVAKVAVPFADDGGQAVDSETMNAKNHQHARAASPQVITKAKRRINETTISDSRTSNDHAVNIAVLDTQADKVFLDQPVILGAPASLKVADSVPRNSFMLPAGPETSLSLRDLESNNPPAVPSFPERQNSRAYSPFSGDMNTQTALFQAQREFLEEFCSPVKSSDHSADKRTRTSTPVEKNACPIAPFRSFQSPGTNGGRFKGNVASTQDLMAAAEALAFSTVKKAKKGKAARPEKKATFVSFTVAKPFSSSDENKDPGKTEGSLSIVNKQHVSAAETSGFSIDGLRNNPPISPKLQPILKKRSSLKQLSSLSKSNSQPTSTSIPSLTSMPAASNSSVPESGTAMPTPYQMGQRMFSTGDEEAELDVDINATLDDFSQFLNVDMTV